jgi:hypothetical protein
MIHTEEITLKYFKNNIFLNSLTSYIALQSIARIKLLKNVVFAKLSNVEPGYSIWMGDRLGIPGVPGFNFFY